MFYITHYNRFRKRYTSQKINKPRLYPYTPNLTEQDIVNLNTPALTESDKVYQTFRIPKAAGGYRTIEAPSEQLKTKQRALLTLLKEKYQLLESPWAYAYIKNTCALDALKEHQKNASKYFLKLDIKDFFPSCTSEIVFDSLNKIFPICSWTSDKQELLKQTIKSYCFLNNRLPQGAVTSPFLSNLTLLPYDVAIHDLLKRAETFKKQKYVYTRYADDLLISAKTPFNWKEITKLVKEILNPNFTIKDNKTRYGTSTGRNWNLGCMLNKDNNITVGHEVKEAWKRTMMNLIIRYSNGDIITKEEKQQIQGKLAYFKMIEPDYFEYLNRHYHQKYKVNFENILKN